MKIRPDDFFGVSTAQADSILAQFDSVFDIIRDLPAIVGSLLSDDCGIYGEVMEGASVAREGVYLAPSARVEPAAVVIGPAYIGDGVVVRSGAYVRDQVILLNHSVVGHASEVKSSLFLPHALAPHFAYVGDSILGSRVNLGAGTKLSNLPITSSRDRQGKRPTIKLTDHEAVIDTGLSKLGAVLGDDVEVGCNAVLSPGTLVGPRSLIYATALVPKGWYAADVIIKHRSINEIVERRPS